MNHFMTHTFITVSFSGKCFLWLQRLVCEDKVGPGHHDDQHHKGPGKALAQAPLEVQRGHVAHNLCQICLPLLLNFI